MTIPDPRNPHEASRRLRAEAEKIELQQPAMDAGHPPDNPDEQCGCAHPADASIASCSRCAIGECGYPHPAITGITFGGKGCINGEEHLYIAWHEPGHNVYWIRTCALCGRPDWDALDDSIRVFIGERLKTLMIKYPNIMATDRTGLYGALRSLFELEKLKPEPDLTNPEESGTL